MIQMLLDKISDIDEDELYFSIVSYHGFAEFSMSLDLI